MNHSKKFHEVRIGFGKELDGELFALRLGSRDPDSTRLTGLTARGYTGDGFWSQGQLLSSEYTAPRVLADGELPENLCGGVYRAAKKAAGGGKRKLTYAEQKQRRKERKFGKSEGDALGLDEKARSSLEKGKGKAATTVKPRVAQSQRGRDLRAEAAAKRMEAMQKEASAAGSSSTSKKEESSNEDDEYTTDDEEGAVDLGGIGRAVKVEEGGDEDWDELQDEMKLACSTSAGQTQGGSGTIGTSSKRKKASSTEAESSDNERDRSSTPPRKAKAARPTRKAATSKTKSKKGKNRGSETESSEDEPSRAALAYAVRRANGQGNSETVQKDKEAKSTEKGKARGTESEDSDDEPPKTKAGAAKAVSSKAADIKPAKDDAANGKQPSISSFVSKAPAASGSTLSSSSSSKPTNVTASHSNGSVGCASAPAMTSAGQMVCSACTTENDPDLALCMICSNVLSRGTTPHWICKTCGDGAYAVRACLSNKASAV